MCWRRSKRKRDFRNKNSLQGYPASFRQRSTSTRQTAACPGHKPSLIINLHDLIRPAKWPRIAFAAKTCRTGDGDVPVGDDGVLCSAINTAHTTPPPGPILDTTDSVILVRDGARAAEARVGKPTPGKIESSIDLPH